jgi:hypothetical protein
LPIILLAEIGKMGKRTGNPRGRPRGAPNKQTVERKAAIATAAKKITDVLGENAFDGDAHAYLMSVYKNVAVDDDTRLKAAAVAIAFEKPKLASIEQKIDADVKQRVVSDKPMSDDEWSDRYGDNLASSNGASKGFGGLPPS